LKVSRSLFKAIGSGLAARAVLLSFVIGAAALACAQSGAMTPNQDESDGVSAGGKWLEFSSTGKMTGAKKVRFELQSDNYFREDPQYKPRVNLYCSDGKLKWADFNPGVRLAPPNRPGFWGQPQLEVMVRVDDTHYFKGWNWMRGRSTGFSFRWWNGHIADVVSLRRLSAARWPGHMPCSSTGVLRNWARRD